jgi:uncharacterized LabA/DUF88 family protein
MLRPEYYFIDGENLVFRYQTMLAEGRTPLPGVAHVEDVFVWTSRLVGQMGDVRRVLYYTSATGDELLLEALTRQMRSLQWQASDGTMQTRGFVVPRIFKKSQKARKSPAVDINIAVDAMAAALNGDAGLVILISGDSDFLPVVEDLMRRGVNVHIGALSSGLNPKMELAGDHFHLLDDEFFHVPAETHVERAPAAGTADQGSQGPGDTSGQA